MDEITSDTLRSAGIHWRRNAIFVTCLKVIAVFAILSNWVLWGLTLLAVGLKTFGLLETWSWNSVFMLTMVTMAIGYVGSVFSESSK